MSKECLWKSPKGSISGFIAESSDNFENKYGINIFSDEVEKSKYVPIKPSDLEFSPQLQVLFTESNSKSTSQLSVSSNIVPPTSSPSRSGSPRIPQSSSGSSDKSSSPRNKSESSYLTYGGGSFGLKPALSVVNSTKASTGNLNPWILSDGIPNFAKNQKHAVMTELVSKSKTPLVDRSDEVIEQLMEPSAKRQKKSSTTDNSEEEVFVDDCALLSAIREELNQYKKIDQKIVDAI